MIYRHLKYRPERDHLRKGWIAVLLIVSLLQALVHQFMMFVLWGRSLEAIETTFGQVLNFLGYSYYFLPTTLGSMNPLIALPVYAVQNFLLVKLALLIRTSLRTRGRVRVDDSIIVTQQPHSDTPDKPPPHSHH